MVKTTSKHLEEWANPRTVIVLTLLFFVALWSFVGFWTVAARQERIAMAGEFLQRMTYAVEDQTRRQFRLINVFLATCAQWLEANPARDPRRDLAFRNMIEGFRSRTGEAIDIRLVATDGRIFDVLGDPSEPPTSAAGSDYFKGAPANGALFIGKPTPRQPDGHFGLPIAVRLADPIDGFSTLVAVIDLTLLTEVYEKQRRKAGGSITLLRHDGTVLAVAPDDAQALGQAVTGGALASEVLAPQLDNVVVVEESAGAQRRQFTSYAAVTDFPLLVTVSADYDEVLAPWLKQTLWIILLALGISVPLLVVAFRSLRLLQALALRDAELQQLATSDQLTGVSNRQHFVETLDEALLRAQQSQSPLTILLCDIDFFKRLNDGYGHAVGDLVLIAFAEVANHCLRAMDLLARVGGGEFAILLHATEASDAVVVAERLRAGIAAISIPTENGTVQFTASVGASQARAGDKSFDDLMKRAAEALADARAGGHDQLVVI